MKKTINKLLEKFMHAPSAVSRWLPVVLWASVIFTFSSLPQTKTSEFFLVDFLIKKTAHLSEYAILYTLIFRATTGNWKLSYVLAIIYAATDEFHQSFTPGRTPRVYDVIGFDFTGMNIAAFTLWKLKPNLKKKQKK